MQVYISGADPGFKVSWGALKKNCAEPREARKCLRYFVWKITILRQKIIFFPIAEGGAKIVGVFRVRNHDFTPKNLIFSNFRGGIYTVNADKSKEEIFDNRRSMLCSLELIFLMLVILIDTICVVFGLWKFSTDGSHSDRYKLCFFCLIYTYIHKRWFPYRRQSGSWRKEEISLSNTDDVIF
jgi:hypothetical protein